MEDRQLLLLFEEDPEKGVHELMNLYGGAIYTICRKFLYDCQEGDIEEAVADTVIHFWQNRQKFIPGENSSLKSYLYGIARNAARDKRRKLKRQEFFPLEEVTLEIPSGENLAEDFEAKESEEILHECIRELKEPDRSIFLYRYFYGYKVKELAEMFGLATKKVENILYRGKEKLRRMLIERGIWSDEKNKNG